jgi:hypothetical protein
MLAAAPDLRTSATGGPDAVCLVLLCLLEIGARDGVLETLSVICDGLRGEVADFAVSVPRAETGLYMPVVQGVNGGNVPVRLSVADEQRTIHDLVARSSGRRGL